MRLFVISLKLKTFAGDRFAHFQKKEKKGKVFFKKGLQFLFGCDRIYGYMDESRAHPLRRRFSSIIFLKS